MTDEREGIERDDGDGVRGGTGTRRAYGAPELVEYGTVAKLTQTGGGSITDLVLFMGMMTCL